MGFKLPGKSIISGTSAHRSALKMKAEADAAAKMKREAAAKMKKNSPMDKALVGKQHNLPEELKAKIEAAPGKMKPSPVKESFSQAYRKNRDAGEKYFTYNGKEYTTESRSEKAEREKRGKTYAEENPKKTTTTETESKYTDMGNEKKDETAPRKEKSKVVDSSKSKVKRRKDGSIKKETEKVVQEDGDGREVSKQKNTYRKDGTKKKEVYKEKDSGYNLEGKYRTKSKTKYDKEGNVKRKKEVDVRDGRRTVTKTDKEGNVTTKSRRTLKGILTGKGKKSKEESSPVTMKPGKSRSKSDKEQFTNILNKQGIDNSKKKSNPKYTEKVKEYRDEIKEIERNIPDATVENNRRLRRLQNKVNKEMGSDVRHRKNIFTGKYKKVVKK